MLWVTLALPLAPCDCPLPFAPLHGAFLLSPCSSASTAGAWSMYRQMLRQPHAQVCDTYSYAAYHIVF